MKYALPGDEITTAIAMTNEDVAYPAANAIDDSPVTGGVSRPLKSTTTSTVITLTASSSVAQAVFLMNLGPMTGATVLWNGGGATNVPITLPSTDLDGHRNNAWLDLTPYTTAATSWTITITGATAGTIQIGRIFLAGTLRDLAVVTRPKFKLIRPDKELKTLGGKAFVYDKGTRNRSVEFSVRHAAARQQLQNLWYSAKGRSLPWPLLPWDDRNDPLWVTFTSVEHIWDEPEGPYLEDASATVEQWMGVEL